MEEYSLPIPTKPLVDILEIFNRKERNLLVRDILGHSEQKLRLSADFLQRIHIATGVTLNADAWWATDYHLDWLFAAVMVFLGTATPGQVQADALPPLMTATQEDADLVIANDRSLILIEAKAYSANNNEQVKRKRRRFEMLQRLAGQNLDLHLLLMSLKSPTDPTHSTNPMSLKCIQLKIDPHLTVCRVKRCDAKGKADKAGGHWVIVELPATDGGWEP